MAAGACSIRVLGSVEVIIDGVVQPLRPMSRRLLAVLAASPRQVVRAERLVEDLWPNDVPDSASKTLQTHIVHLRRTLGHQAIAHRAMGYELDLDVVSLDAAELGERLREADRHLQSGDHAAAGDQLERAMQLLRGEPFDSYAVEEFAVPEAARLDELSCHTVERWAELALQCGRGDTVVADLERLVARRPLRESGWVLLITALQSADRATEATCAYDRAALAIHRELGIEPGAALRRAAAKPAASRQREARLPPALRSASGFGFVGRAAELAELRAAWNDVRGGETRTVLIVGEPGVGKSALVTELVRSVERENGHVLAGRCDELASMPYLPLVEALRWHIERHGAQELGDLPAELAGLAPEIRMLRPDLPHPPAVDPDAQRLRLFDAVRSWLVSTARQHHVLLVIDDLQWADLGTLLLVRHIAATNPVDGLLLVATHRDGEIDPSHPLRSVLSEFRQRADVRSLELPGLDLDDVARLVAIAAPRPRHRQATPLADVLHRDTAGNAFFVTEVLRFMTGTGWDADASGSQLDEKEPTVALPEGVRNVVRRRFEAFAEPTRRALLAAAVIGADFDLELLATTIDGVSEDHSLALLEPALQARFIAEVAASRFRFSHAIVRSSLVDDMSATRRARLHRRVAIGLETLHLGATDAVAVDLAHHWAGAQTLDGRRRAAHYARQAAAAAYRALAPHDACRLYRQSLALTGGSDGRSEAEVYTRLAEAEKTAGLGSFAETQLAAARLAVQIDDLGLMTEALLLSARFFYVAGAPPNPEKIQLLERALSRCRSEEGSVRARLTAELAVELFFTSEPRRHATMREARACVGAIADPHERAQTRVRLIKATPLSAQDRVAWLEAQRQIDGDRESILETADPRVHLDLLQIDYLTALALGDADRWQRQVHDLRALAERSRHPEVEFLLRFAEMLCALIDGRLDDAERHAREALATSVSVAPADHASRPSRNEATVRREVESVRFQIAIGRGRLGELVNRLRSNGAALDADGPPTVVRARLGFALAEAGDTDEAMTLIGHASRQGFADVPDDSARGIALAFWASAAARVGHETACSALIELLAPHADLHIGSGVWYLGSNAHYLGLLYASIGRVKDARHRFAQSVDAHRAFRTPPWQAASLTEWAVLEMSAGSAATGRRLAHEALHVIGDLPLERCRSISSAIVDAV